MPTRLKAIQKPTVGQERPIKPGNVAGQAVPTALRLGNIQPKTALHWLGDGGIKPCFVKT